MLQNFAAQNPCLSVQVDDWCT